MIIDFRVRPPLPGFEKLSILGAVKGYQTFPFNFDENREIESARDMSMPKFINEMDEAGIVKGVVLPRTVPGGYGGVSNDEVAGGVAKYADRLIGFGVIDISERTEYDSEGRPTPADSIACAVQEVERAVRQLGLRGIVMEPGCMSPALKPDAARLYPVYERCSELGVPVVISQSMYLGPDLSFANPECLQHVAKDFPRGKFIIAHASYPWVLAADAVACVCENVYLIPDIYCHMPDIAGGSLFAHGIRLTHGKRFLFGSAYPVRGMKQSVEDVRNFALPEALYRRYTYDNAAELLGL